MAIPEEQLKTWANSGAMVLSQQTHESIRLALESGSSLVKEKKPRVYLQGSYKNSTNIRGDSDVDVVVELQSTFYPDTSLLSPIEKENYKSAFPNSATYVWKDFRADVIQSLKNYYGGGAIREGNKSIKLLPNSGRLSADIIPCIQYRKYTRFIDAQNNAYISGIKFYTIKESRAVVNYPEIHYNFGTEKNGQSRTNGWFKPTIRIFKNARNRMLEQFLIPKGVASSYHIENLLYNVPDKLYGESYGRTFYNIVNWLLTTDLATLTCQNQQVALFGTGEEDWKISHSLLFVDGLKKLWTGWK